MSCSLEETPEITQQITILFYKKSVCLCVRRRASSETLKIYKIDEDRTISISLSL